jgi:hypothetical protein
LDKLKAAFDAEKSKIDEKVTGLERRTIQLKAQLVQVRIEKA